MAAPPFAAPKGMRWSPTRKRFFPLNAPRAVFETAAEPAVVVETTPTHAAAAPASAFEHPRAGATCFGTTALRNALPRAADPRRLINGRAANLRLRAVHSLLPFCTYQRPNITCLAYSEQWPDHIWLATDQGSARGYLPALMASNGTLRREMRFDPACTAILRDSQGLADIFCSASYLCFSSHLETVAVKLDAAASGASSCEAGPSVLRLQSSRDEGQPRPRDDVRCAALAPLHPSHVFAKQTSDALLLARGVGSTLELRAPHLHNLVETLPLPSDVLSLLVAPDGAYLLVGLRNGKLLRLALGYEAPKGAGSKRQYRVLRRYRGAVTALRWAGAHVVVATSKGELMLIEPSGVEVQAYVGHHSTFSLTLPVAVESRHRLLAAAGEDGVVRVWSLDHALPLSGAPLPPATAPATLTASAATPAAPAHEAYERGAVLGSVRGATALAWLGELPRLAVAVGPRLLYFD